MMTVDVLEGFVARIANAAVELHGGISRVAYQSVCAVITHRDFVCQVFSDIHFVHLIHLRRGFIDQQTQHLGLGLQLNERELNPLIG